jgi:Fic family protein
MDRQRFTDFKTGELIKFRNLHSGKDDWMFIPNELPPAWDFPPRLWPLLSEAREELGRLDGIGQTLQNPQLLLRPLQTREAITSSSIEGTYVTPQQLLLYELDRREPTSADSEVADWNEVFNYGTALQQGCRLLQEIPVCSRLIRKMHKNLLAGVRGERKNPGEFRTIQVQIGATGRYIPPPPVEIDRLMSNLEKYIHQGDARFDPLVLCYMVHYQFEAIHPFSDGNGRVGRALLALMIYRWLNHAMPWLYMSAFYEKYKEEYADNLFRISTHGDWERWIEFCLTGTVAQARDAIRRCHEFNRLRQEYHDRIGNTSTPRSHKIVELLFTAPVVTIPSLADVLQVTYHTARDDVRRLVEAGVLFESVDSYPRSFYARELMEIAYGSAEETTA